MAGTAARTGRSPCFNNLDTPFQSRWQVVIAVFAAGQLTPLLVPIGDERWFRRTPVDVSGFDKTFDSARAGRTDVAYERVALGDSDAQLANRCDNIIPSPRGFPPLSNRTIQWIHIPKVYESKHHASPL